MPGVKPARADVVPLAAGPWAGEIGKERLRRRNGTSWRWGQVGLTGWTWKAARPVARAIARRNGRPEAEILSLIGSVFLAITLIDFLREVDAVIAAGRTGRQLPGDGPAGARTRTDGARAVSGYGTVGRRNDSFR